jgi:hypothetical protein
MDVQYRKLDGTPVNDLASYTKDYLRKHTEVSLSVGTDSQILVAQAFTLLSLRLDILEKAFITSSPKSENPSSAI